MNLKVSLALVGLTLLGAAQSASADSLFTFTGDFRSVSNDAYAFDGMDFTTLPGLFDGLAGGTFRATYFVPTVTAPTNPAFNFASYAFPTPYGFTFTLYNSNGNVVMEGTGDPQNNRASVSNNVPVQNFSGTLIGYADLVELTGFSGTISGLQTPPVLYGPPDVFIGSTAFRFTDFTTLPNIPTDVTDLNLPLDAATYLGFPNATFSTGAFWGSGDYNDQINPFQYDDSSVNYNIRGVTITSVPEPGSVALLVGMGLSGAGFLLRRRRRRQ